MRRGVIATAGVLAVLAFASPAMATLRVESSAKSGLVLEDKNGTFDDFVTVALVSTATGLEWRVVKTDVCGTLCLDLVRFELGPNCRAFDASTAACARLGAGVNGNLRSGNDRLAVGGTLPITDAMTIDLGPGADAVISGAGPDVLSGGSGIDLLTAGGGADTVSGGSGDDRLDGSAGDDTLNGGDGNDRLVPGEGADTANGDAGDDLFRLGTGTQDARDTVNGGIGGDTASYAREEDIGGGSPGRATRVRVVEAPLETLGGAFDFSEGDVLRSMEIYEGGEDEDILTGAVSGLPSTYKGGRDDDVIFGSNANNTLVGGPGGDSLDGNGGTDTLDGKDGEGKTAQADPVIDCGAGEEDLAVIDLKDDATPTGCEHIDRSPAGEGPHVKPTIPKRFTVAGGRISVRMSCPRALKKPCRGTLRVRTSRRSQPPTSYSIKPGSSRRVTVAIGSLRGVAQLVSLEQGIHGLKTTLRRVTLA